VLTPQVLYAAVHGDLEAFAQVSKQPHDAIVECRLALSELVLTPQSICNVLVALKRNEVSPELVRQWASFVKRGYVTYWSTVQINMQENALPVAPIEIDYDLAFEEEIVEVISRLDEIGDIVEGEIITDDLDKWINGFPCVVSVVNTQELPRRTSNK
jgi:hypothetical protein